MKKTSYFFLGVGALLGVAMMPTNAKAMEVGSAEELVECVAGDEAVCTLTGDVELTARTEIHRSMTIDLNGHNIEANFADKMFDVEGAALTVTGTGTIENKYDNGNSIPFRVFGSEDESKTDYTILTIDSGVTLKSKSYSLFVSHKNHHAYGVVVNFAGKTEDRYGLYVNGSVQDYADNAPIFDILDGASVKTDGGVAVYAAGYATWNIGKATIEGEGGLGIKAGKVILNESTVRATGEYVEPQPYGNGINAAGATIQIESNDAYADHIHIEINGGEYTSENGHVFYEYRESASVKSTVQDLKIVGGRFEAGEGKAIFQMSDNFTIENFIEDGEFSEEPDASEIVEGYEAEEEDGVWKIVPIEIDFDGLEVETDNGKAEFQEELIADRKAYLEVFDDYDVADFSAENGKLVKVFDVTLNDRDGNEIGVKDNKVVLYVELSAEEYTALKEYDKVEVVYFDDDGKETERLAAEIGEVEDEGVMRYFVKFNTTHFSAYGVVGVDEEAKTVTPNTGAFTKMEDRAERLVDMVRLSVGMLATGMMLVGAGLIMRGRAYIERNNNLDK